jgi:hypothetical protein
MVAFRRFGLWRDDTHSAPAATSAVLESPSAGLIIEKVGGSLLQRAISGFSWREGGEELVCQNFYSDELNRLGKKITLVTNAKRFQATN